MNPFPKSFPKIRIFADNNYGSGANNALRGLLQSMKHLGLSSEHVYVIPISNGIGMYQEMGDNDWLHAYIYRDIPEDQISIVCAHPSHLFNKHTTINSRVNIAYCPWETDRLPTRFAEEMNKWDQVWAPTVLVRDTFERSGVTAPIYVVPHALQEELLDEAPKKTADWPERGGMLNYYFIGSCNPRKNPEALVRAWCKQLDNGWNITTPVRLTMHLVPPARDPNFVDGHSFMAQEMARQFVNSLGDKKTAIPSFGLKTAPRHFRDVVQMHKVNHVFVSPSRGEGFSLAAAEAAAMGNLVIASPYAAPCLDDIPGPGEPQIATWYRLAAQPTPICPMPEVDGFELDQNWWEPAALHQPICLCQPLYTAHRETQHEAQRVRDHLSPRAVAEKFLRARLEDAAEVVAKSGW